MSVVLNGSSQWLLTNTAPLTATPFFIVGWGKTADTTTWHTIFGLSDKDVDNHYWSCDFGGGSGGDPIRFVCDGGVGQENAETTTGYSINTWTHAAAFAKSATDRRVYISGGSVGTNTVSRTPAGIDRFTVGTRGGFSNVFPFNGKLAHVAIYNATGLSDADVETAIANLAGGDNPLAVQPSKLIAYWPLFNDPNDDKETNHLTEIASPTYDTGDNPTVDGPPSQGFKVILTQP